MDRVSLRPKFGRWLTVSGSGVLAVVFLWSANLLLRGDAYVERRFEALMQDLAKTQKLSERARGNLDQDQALLDTARSTLEARLKDPDGAKLLLDAEKHVIDDVEERTIEVGAGSGYLTRLTPAALRRVLQSRPLFDSIFRSVTDDSILVSLLSFPPRSAEAQSRAELSLFLGIDMARWRAVKAWLDARSRQSRETDWKAIEDDDRRFRRELYSLVAGMFPRLPTSEHPVVSRLLRMEADRDEVIEVHRRLRNNRAAFADLKELAETRLALAVVGFFGSLLVLLKAVTRPGSPRMLKHLRPVSSVYPP